MLSEMITTARRCGR